MFTGTEHLACAMNLTVQNTVKYLTGHMNSIWTSDQLDFWNMGVEYRVWATAAGPVNQRTFEVDQQ